MLRDGTCRSVLFLHLVADDGRESTGEIAPLPSRSKENLAEALYQFYSKRSEILRIDWTLDSLYLELEGLNLLSSCHFALESALLAILDPLPPYTPSVSAFLMGSLSDVLEQAKWCKKEGYRSAKLKVGHFSFAEAKEAIDALKDSFSLRIDVNRAWETQESLRFFSKYPLDAFDYVEEPFHNPKDLFLFPHPLAIDESFPDELSLEDLSRLPTLKALIYKPSLQGGIGRCFPLHTWTTKRGIELVLSSSFETEIGLNHIESMARRLLLSSHVGTGTRHFLLHRTSLCT